MTLCDTGPLLSLLSSGDRDYARCAAVLSTLKLPLVTTWACLAEAMHMLNRYGGHRAQDSLWDYVEKGVLTLHFHDETERRRMRALMRQYADTPMDLADASLVAAAETLRTRRILTLDSDFHVYRLADGNAFEVLP